MSSESESAGERASDGGYVHRPDGHDPSEPEPTGFGRQGWLLVGAVVVCFLVIPGIIYLFPYVVTGLGLSFFASYLVLPLIPAVLLGAVAVWTMTAAA
ncbi:hypothetical protein ACNS7O_02560 [Haloferacaceae archaeon DSL9]